MDVNPPLWFRAGARPGAGVFAALFTLESMARATTVTVVPMQAYELFKEKAVVSGVVASISLCSLAFGFLTPFLIFWFKRRWVYTAGVIMGVLAALGLAMDTVPGQLLAMLFRSTSSVACSICLMLYVMDFIPRQQMVRSEPLRLFMSCFAWGLGPPLGVELYEYYGPTATAAVSIGSYALLFLYFWYLRISDNPAVAAATRPPPNPFRSLRRFVSQPRLLLGWLISFGRSAWWSMFFVYPVLYLKDHGVDDSWSGILAGAGNILLVLTLPIGWLARRTGIRRPITISFWCAGVLTIGFSLFFGSPIAVVTLAMLGALFIVCLDALGNIPFMRAVRPYERPQMTSVFRSYIDLGDLLPSTLYTILLLHFDLKAVFIASGLMTLAIGIVALRLPKSM
jgi:MFS family permease